MLVSRAIAEASPTPSEGAKYSVVSGVGPCAGQHPGICCPAAVGLREH
jgi:hypothetical protein